MYYSRVASCARDVWLAAPHGDAAYPVAAAAGR